jgi:hypothetical protein
MADAITPRETSSRKKFDIPPRTPKGVIDKEFMPSSIPSDGTNPLKINPPIMPESTVNVSPEAVATSKR